MLVRLLADRRAKRSVALVTRLQDGFAALIHPGDREHSNLPEEVVAEALRALAKDVSRSFEQGAETYFIRSYNPSPRMVIVGAVHIAQSLAEMARLAGFQVVVVDPRQAFANTDRFAGIEILTEWPGQALEQLDLDGRTAVVTLTHDPKLDDPALDVALASPVFYIGSLGSKKTHRARLERLASRGFSETDRERIRGPVGLSIGSVTPAEIAVSILAEVIGALRSGSS